MRKPPVLMSTLSESDRWRADRRAEKEEERKRGTVRVVDNGGVVVLRKLVKGQSRLKQTATIPKDLSTGKLLQVCPKQLAVTECSLNEIRLMGTGLCVCLYVHNYLVERQPISSGGLWGFADFFFPFLHHTIVYLRNLHNCCRELQELTP